MKIFPDKVLMLFFLLATLNIFAAQEKIMPVSFVGDPPPELDGSMERMAQLASSITLQSAKNIYSGQKDWQGAKDLSGNVVLGYDGANLYIAADVRDDMVEQNYYAFLRSRAIDILSAEPFATIDDNIDVVISVGGDGTLAVTLPGLVGTKNKFQESSYTGIINEEFIINTKEDFYEDHKKDNGCFTHLRHTHFSCILPGEQRQRQNS